MLTPPAGSRSLGAARGSRAHVPEPAEPRAHGPQGKTSPQDCSSDLLRKIGLRQSRAGSGRGPPMTVRYGGAQVLPSEAASVAARHVGRCPGFADEHQPFGGEIGLSIEPLLPSRQDVRSILLCRVRKPLFNVIWWRANKRHSVPIAKWRPSSACRARISTSVRSSRSAIRAWIRCDSRPPPRGLAAALPVWRSRVHQRTALAVLTPNLSAAWRLDRLVDTAAITRSRRSGDRDAGLRPGLYLESVQAAQYNPSRVISCGKRSKRESRLTHRRPSFR